MKTVSSIHNLHIGPASDSIAETELAKYSDVVHFRRGVYIEDDDNITIPDSLLILFQNDSYRIFINANGHQCLLCNDPNRNADQCPSKNDLKSKLPVISDP